jgi:UDP-N-acetyl-D-mannosaminuronate dehydrogenase
VQRDPILEKEENVVLYSDIKKAMAGADLVIVVANHNEYRSLNPDVIRNAVVYDGRRVLSDNFKNNKKVLYELLGMGL